MKKWLTGIIICLTLASLLTALGFGSIVMDGYFDDWEDKPHTEIWHGKYDEESAYPVALFRDGDQIYLHVMHCIDEADQPFREFNFQIRINGEKRAYNMKIDKVSGDAERGNIAVSYKNEVIGEGIYLNGEAGGADQTQVEIAIPLSAFVDHVDRVKEIAVKIPSYGKEEVVYTGISSGPIWLIVIGFFIAITSLFIFQRKKAKAVAEK